MFICIGADNTRDFMQNTKFYVTLFTCIDKMYYYAKIYLTKIKLTKI